MSKCQVIFCEAPFSLQDTYFSVDLFWRGPRSICVQILYANEGECRKEADMETVPQGDKTNCLPHKGHEFIPTLYHFPSNCEACAKPLWHVFKPPPALECRRCHVKCHKDHLDKKEDVIAPCKGRVLSVAVETVTMYERYIFRAFSRRWAIINRKCLKVFSSWCLGPNLEMTV